MKYQLVGYKEFDFKGHDGSQINYVSLYLVDTNTYDFVIGNLTHSVNISPKKFDNLINNCNENLVGSYINIDYNDKGKLLNVTLFDE